jgi:hypothetical protein
MDRDTRSYDLAGPVERIQLRAVAPRQLQRQQRPMPDVHIAHQQVYCRMFGIFAMVGIQQHSIPSESIQ